MRACSSGVSFGIRRSGSRAGSPGGSEPSGSSRAARCPCIRIALTSAIAAAMPPRSSLSSSATAGAGAGSGAGRRRRCDRRRVTVPVGGGALEQPREAGLPLQQHLGLALEEVAPLLRHGAGVVEVLLEEQRGVARVQPVDVGTSHVHVRCSRAASLPERLAEGDRDREPEEEADGADEHGRELEAPLAGCPCPPRRARSRATAGSGGAGATRARRG